MPTVAEHRTIACPMCQAPIGKACVLPSGHRMHQGHAARRQAASVTPDQPRLPETPASVNLPCPRCQAAPGTPCSGPCGDARTTHRARRALARTGDAISSAPAPVAPPADVRDTPPTPAIYEPAVHGSAALPECPDCRPGRACADPGGCLSTGTGPAVSWFAVHGWSYTDGSGVEPLPPINPREDDVVIAAVTRDRHILATAVC